MSLSPCNLFIIRKSFAYEYRNPYLSCGIMIEIVAILYFSTCHIVVSAIARRKVIASLFFHSQDKVNKLTASLCCVVVVLFVLPLGSLFRQFFFQIYPDQRNKQLKKYQIANNTYQT